MGRAKGVWFRRTVVLVLSAIVVLALANRFGQRQSVSVVRSAPASLSVRAPSNLRGGLIYELRIEIRATDALHHAHLVIGDGWLEGMTMNTLEPTPANETSADGQLKLALGHIAAGQTFVQFIQMQVNPTTAARRTATVSLLDGNRRLATSRRTLTIFP